MKKILLPLILMFSLKFGKAQPRRYKFDHFTVRDGLPEKLVQCIQQDSRGYVWIGTQNGVVRFDGYNYKVYRFGADKNALMQSCSVQSIVEDHHNVLWFGTVGNGIFRYNRSSDTFTQFKYPDKGDNHDNVSQFLAFADKDNNLWTYSNNYINQQQVHIDLFNTKTGKFKAFNKALSNRNHLEARNVFNIFKSANEQIWLGTDNGFYSYDFKSSSFKGYLTNADTNKRDTVDLVYEAPSEPGVLWLHVVEHLSKKSIIIRFDTHNNLYKKYNSDDSRRRIGIHDTVNAVYEDRQKHLWFATMQGLLLLNRATGEFTRYMPADTGKWPDKNQLYGIVEAKNGSLWLNSGKGLLNFDPAGKHFQRYIHSADDPYSISGNSIYTAESGINNNLMLDHSGILWAGIENRGVDKIDPQLSAFSIYKADPSNKDSYPGGITQQIDNMPGGGIIFSNNKGIYQWQPGTDHFNQLYKATKKDGYLGAVAYGKDGNIYFGNQTGLQIYNPVTKKQQSYTSVPGDTASLSSNTIQSILQDHTGKVWVGTHERGICTFDPVSHKFKRYPFISNNGLLKSGDVLNDNDVLRIYEDVAGTIWIGTNLGGLSKFDRKTGKFISFLTDGKVRITCVDNIVEDREGRLWASTYLDGLWQFDQRASHYARHFNESNGLLFNSVAAAHEDKKGFLWINSDRGLTRLNLKDFSLKNYPYKTLLPGQNLSPNAANFTAVNGKIVIGLSNAIAVFNPDELSGNPYPPIVHIEKVTTSNPRSTTDTPKVQSAYQLNKIQLPWDHNEVTFNYIALHYVNPAENKYAYILEGYDDDWVQAGGLRSVTYTNLDPATYTFRVKAANSDGVWNNNGDSIIIIIRPPWWTAWWAWLLYIVVFISAVYAFIEYRSRKLKREKLVLEEKISLRTKQLSLANKELSDQQEKITSQRDQLAETLTDLKATQTQLIQSEKMASLGELTAGIAHEIQNPLNFVNNFSEVNTEMIDELEEELKLGNVDEALAITADIRQNEVKINHHGKRADFIVKGMLQHSRISTGERQLTNINVLADEFFKLSYHGLRAKDKSFNADMVTNFDDSLPLINIVQQDIGRVLLNLFNNAFYAVQQKQKTAGAVYKPTVTVETFFLTVLQGSPYGQGIGVIKVKDNGIGIPENIKEKIMQPFFTTKPTGEGTGLGLSLSYDIVVKGHGGTIDINSKKDEGSEFIIKLPAD